MIQNSADFFPCYFGSFLKFFLENWEFCEYSGIFFGNLTREYKMIQNLFSSLIYKFFIFFKFTNYLTKIPQNFEDFLKNLETRSIFQKYMNTIFSCEYRKFKVENWKFKFFLILMWIQFFRKIINFHMNTRFFENPINYSKILWKFRKNKLRTWELVTIFS